MIGVVYTISPSQVEMTPSNVVQRVSWMITLVHVQRWYVEESVSRVAAVTRVVYVRLAIIKTPNKFLPFGRSRFCFNGSHCTIARL